MNSLLILTFLYPILKIPTTIHNLNKETSKRPKFLEQTQPLSILSRNIHKEPLPLTHISPYHPSPKHFEISLIFYIISFLNPPQFLWSIYPSKSPKTNPFTSPPTEPPNPHTHSSHHPQCAHPPPSPAYNAPEHTPTSTTNAPGKT